jgi:MFS family permease
VSEVEATAAAPSPSPMRLALSLAPGTLFAGIAGGIVFPIFPIVGLRVGLSTFFIGAILAANRAVRVVCAPVVGVLVDRIGGRRTLLIGLAIQVAVIGLFIAGLELHHEGAGFLGGRLLHGLGSACVFVSAQALALQGSTTTNRGATASLVRTTMVIGIPIGFVLGGLLSETIGVTGAFLFAGVSTVVALIAAAITVPDLKATVAVRPSIGRVVAAARDLRLLAIGGLNFVLAFAGGGMVLTTLAFLVQDRGYTALGRNVEGTAGLLMGVMSIADGGLTPIAGRIGDRWRAHASVAAVSLVLIAGGLVWIAEASDVATTAMAIGVVGIGSAGLGPSVLVLLGDIIQPTERGLGAGLLQLCGDFGGMLGPLIGTSIFASSTELPYLVTAGLVMAFVPVALWLRRVEKP